MFDIFRSLAFLGALGGSLLAMQLEAVGNFHHKLMLQSGIVVHI